MSDLVTLNSVCSAIVDCEHKTAPESIPGQEYGYSIGTPNIRNGRIILNSAKRVDEATYRAWSVRAVLRKNDIILTREAPAGEAALVDGTVPVCLGQRTVMLRPDASVIVPRYLHYRLLGPTVQEAIGSRSGGSTVAHLNVQEIRNLILGKLPDLPTQYAIAAILGALDDKISVNDSITLIVDELLAAEFSMETQEVERAARIGDIADFKYGKALKEVDRSPGKIPVFGGNGRSGWHNTPLDLGPGIIVGRKGANAGSVSWSQGPFWAIDTAFYVRSLSPEIPLVFLYFLLDRAGLRDYVGDSAIPGLNREIALSCTVQMPPSHAIQRFCAKVVPLLNDKEQKAEESRMLAELRDYLLPRLMSGEIRVRDAEKAVEDVT